VASLIKKIKNLGDKMADIQLDVNKIVESLVNQISQQAQRIAVLEATIDAIQKTQLTPGYQEEE
jgi:hypothetical protein